MPQGRYSSHRTFNISVFDPRVLGTPRGLQTALDIFDGVCHQGDRGIADIISALIDRPHILEYIISVLDEDAYKNLSKWMVSEFPEPATPNMMGTTSMRLLQRFSSSLLSVECPSVDDSPPDLRVFWRKVEFSFDVLKELEKSAKSILPSRNTSIAGRKKSRTVVKVRRIDPLPFDSMGISVPTTDVEVLDVYVEVLSQLQNILENYLLVLRKSLISKIFKSSIFGSTCVKANLSSEVEMVSMGKAIGTDQYGGPVFSVIQPMMAVLYSGDVEGFGEWSILLSTNGEKTRIGDNDFRICLLEEKTRSHCPF